MRKVIGLYGSAKKGKTETLNLLIDLLEVITTNCPMPTAQIGNDRKMTFNYNGQIVSICTAGDGESELKENEKYFLENNCDIAISATRTSGKTCDVLKSLASSNSICVDWLKQIYDFPNRNQVNLNQANRLLSMI